VAVRHNLRGICCTATTQPRRAASPSTTRTTALCTNTVTRNAAESKLYQEDRALGRTTRRRHRGTAALRADDAHDAEANTSAPWANSDGKRLEDVDESNGPAVDSDGAYGARRRLSRARLDSAADTPNSDTDDPLLAVLPRLSLDALPAPLRIEAEAAASTTAARVHTATVARGYWAACSALRAARMPPLWTMSAVSVSSARISSASVDTRADDPERFQRRSPHELDGPSACPHALASSRRIRSCLANTSYLGASPCFFASTVSRALQRGARRPRIQHPQLELVPAALPSLYADVPAGAGISGLPLPPGADGVG
jgi:hypothetical protein